MAQISPVNAIIIEDLNGDGNNDLIISGNNFNTEVETQRYDAGIGLIMLGNGKGDFEPIPSFLSGFYASGNTKDMIQCLIGSAKIPYLILANNNAAPEIFKINKEMFSKIAYK